MIVDGPSSVTPVEHVRAGLDAETDRQRRLSEPVVGALIGAVAGAAAGSAVGAVLVVVPQAPAIVIALCGAVGIFFGVLIGFGVVGVRAEAARREFAVVRERARAEPPVRRRWTSPS